MAENGREFVWSKKKLKIAKTIADGTKTIDEVAEECDISPRSIFRLKAHPEFMEKVDEFTLAHENATKAGLLRECYKGLDSKRGNIDSDRTTHLDYVKEIVDIQGYSKHTIKHEGIDGINVIIKHEPRTDD